MDAIEAIMTRRSIRKYSDQPVGRETIEVLLRAAMAAPTAGNQQSWRFVVIDDPGLLARIPTFHPYAQMLPEAKAAIVVCGETVSERHPGYWVQDCAAATYAILVAARAVGLGAVWLGVYPSEERVAGFVQLLGLPGEITPLSCVPLGYPAEQKPPSDRYDPDKVRSNGWT
jgi:nitroreductase